MTGIHETAHADLDRIDIEDDQGPGGIAIIGMSGRFPGAPSVEALWELVRDGRNAFSIFAPDEIEDCFTDEERAAANYVAARPHLPDVDMFDAEFFGMFAREAALTDPQHRVFLEICWEALENGGYDPHRYAGMIGVFAGSSMPTYLINNVLGDRAKAEEFVSNYQIGCFQQLVGALNDALATRIAYKFDLRGPAFTLQSACSTSLLAVSQACQKPTDLCLRHGARWRRVRRAAAKTGIYLPGRRHGFGRRHLPAVRCERGWNRLCKRRRRRTPEEAGRRAKGPRSHLRSHPRLRHQQ